MIAVWMSARFFWINWKPPIALPNCLRMPAYWAAASNAFCASCVAAKPTSGRLPFHVKVSTRGVTRGAESVALRRLGVVEEDFGKMALAQTERFRLLRLE